MQKPRERLELGDRAKHIVTGFEGIVVAKVDYLQGCQQVALQPQGLNKDGQPIDTIYFDEPFVELLEEDVIQLEGAYAGFEREVVPLRRLAGPTRAPGKDNGRPTPPNA